MATSKRESLRSRATHADTVLNNPAFQAAQAEQREEIISAMINMDMDKMNYEEAAGRALSLVIKYQAVDATQRSLQMLLNHARLDRAAQ